LSLEPMKPSWKRRGLRGLSKFVIASAYCADVFGR
jgi:hypothetical protein